MKQHMGFADPANRKPLAVERTAAMAGLLLSLLVVWFAEHDHKHVEFPHRPWYRQKKTASRGNMLTTLSEQSWQGKCGGRGRRARRSPVGEAKPPTL